MNGRTQRFAKNLRRIDGESRINKKREHKSILLCEQKNNITEVTKLKPMFKAYLVLCCNA